MSKVTKPKSGVKNLLKTIKEIERENIEEFFIRNNAYKSYKRYNLEFEDYIFILDGKYVWVDDREDVVGVKNPTLEQVKALILGFTKRRLC